MTHVVTESCILCKHTDCVDVCPVDCFRETPFMMVIDPDECIDCAVCIPECPVNAIWAEEDLPSKQIGFLAINQKLAITGAAITRRKSPLPNAEAWKNVPGKAILAQSSLTDLRLSEIEGKMSKLKNLVTAEELLPNEWSSDTLSEKNFSRLKLISL